MFGIFFLTPAILELLRLVSFPCCLKSLYWSAWYLSCQACNVWIAQGLVILTAVWNLCIALLCIFLAMPAILEFICLVSLPVCLESLHCSVWFLSRYACNLLIALFDVFPLLSEIFPLLRLVFFPCRLQSLHCSPWDFPGCLQPLCCSTWYLYFNSCLQSLRNSPRHLSFWDLPPLHYSEWCLSLAHGTLCISLLGISFNALLCWYLFLAVHNLCLFSLILCINLPGTFVFCALYLRVISALFLWYLLTLVFFICEGKTEDCRTPPVMSLVVDVLIWLCFAWLDSFTRQFKCILLSKGPIADH